MDKGFVSGHDFSRAEKSSQITSGLQPPQSSNLEPPQNASLVDISQKKSEHPLHRRRLSVQTGYAGLTSDEDAEFTALVQRQSRFVFRVAYAVLLNSNDAEDAAQETFLKLYRNGGWRGAENERAFLARAAWRVAQDSRRRRAERGDQGVPETTGTALELPSLAPTPEQTTLDSSRQALVHSMIDALPEDLRIPLVLSAFQELNSREIGNILAIPEGTVRTRIQRARQVLRQKLESIESRQEVARHA